MVRKALKPLFSQQFHKVSANGSPLVQTLSNAFISKKNVDPSDINDDDLPSNMNDAFNNAMFVCNTIIQDSKLNENNKDYKLDGFKIAATSAEAQSILKVDNPFLGPILETFDTNKNGIYKYKTSEHNYTIGVECEFGFILNEKIEKWNSNSQLSVDDVLSCIDCCIPTIEIVQTRIVPFMEISCLLMASDMGGSGVFVVNTDENNGKITFGGLKEFEKELANVKVECIVNNQIKGEGSGLNVMKSPLFALQWALNQLLFDKKQILQKGDIISTGTSTGLTPVQPGDQIIAKYSHPVWKQHKNVSMTIL